jgi:putative chitinase
MTSMNISVFAVAKMFPATPQGNIARNLPYLMAAFDVAGLDRAMLLMALATIRAECASFTPECEGVSRFNTSVGGHLFDLYDNRADIGNRGFPDGEMFRGRGYVQLTGRYNYIKYGAELALPMEIHPEMACEPHIASTLLVRFLTDHDTTIRKCLAMGDYASARRAVNGGTHGLEAFTDAYERGLTALPTC